jgi:hypothetical protein
VALGAGLDRATCRPRNIRIAYIEDRLLDLANDKRGQIELIPEPSTPSRPKTRSPSARARDLRGQPVAHLEHFSDKFGAADPVLYGLDGEQVRTWCSACG